MVKRFLALYLMMALVMTGMALVEWKNQPTGNVVLETVDAQVVEVTEVDFVGSGFTGDSIAVYGVMLGDTLEQVTEKLGAPDLFKPVPTNDGGEVVNLEYKLGAPTTALIVNVQYGEVQRITLLSPFNQFLIGESKMGYGKGEAYRKFGIPDNQEPIKGMWLYTYNDQGFDFFLENTILVGYSFFTEPLFVNQYRKE